jgi:nucleotide sugar dehydrogenase
MNENQENVMNMSVNEVLENVKSKNLTICIIGTGRIGLPTAISFANYGFSTIGVDINSDLVNDINKGKFPLKDEPDMSEVFDKVISGKKLIASTDLKTSLSKSNVILLSLPTPMNKENIPDYNALLTVAKDLGKLMSQNSLIVVESTVEPGFVEKSLIPQIESEGKFIAGKNFGIGVCPETANPGAIMKDFRTLPRLVGGINEKSTEIISIIYRHVFPVKLIPMPDCKTANAVKLTTNVFRDLNIAFVNELAILFENLGIDIFTVLEAAKTKYNFQIHYPGAGVGGPCLPVNSYQMINSASNFSKDFLQLVKISRKINEKMPEHVIKLLKDALSEVGKKIEGSTITILGISYKPNVKDIQLTPAKDVIDLCQKLNCKLKIYDPYFESQKVFSFITEKNISDAIKDSDAIILITDHKEFFSIDLDMILQLMKKPVIIDAKNVFDINELRKNKIIFRGIGRRY